MCLIKELERKIKKIASINKAIKDFIDEQEKEINFEHQYTEYHKGNIIIVWDINMPKGKHVRIPHFSITINISFNDVESMENCLNNEEFQNAQGKLVNCFKRRVKTPLSERYIDALNGIKEVIKEEINKK